MMGCELSILIPTAGRPDKLRTLLSGLARTQCAQDSVEVVVVVDGHDETPLQAGSVLPPAIHFKGITHPPSGPAKTRNEGLKHVRGEWVLFLDDDMRVDEHTVPGHLKMIRQNPRATQAYLGRVDAPPDQAHSPWATLLAESSMLFFWDRMDPGASYGFRHFWSSNLSVRRDLVQSTGGFCESFDDAMHEDIELGYRLQQDFGLCVRYIANAKAWHDHPVTPREYFQREYRSGRAARHARAINQPFHDQVWGWIGDPDRLLATLTGLFAEPAREVKALLQQWALPSERRPSALECRYAYLAHLPLKRMTFCHGYLGRPFEDLWDPL